MPPGRRRSAVPAVDGEVHALVAEDGARSGRPSRAVGATTTPVAVGQQLAELADERGAVADHRRPARRPRPWPRRVPRARSVIVQAGASVCDEQAVERQVQRREVPPTSAPSVAPQVTASVRGQVGLLGEDVGGPVAHAARARPAGPGPSGPSRSKSSVLAVGQPRQPRLHAVEDQALGQPLPLLAAPRLGGDERLGPLADLVGRQQLAAREDLDLGEVDRSSAGRSTENSVSRSTSSPHRSMRTGDVGGRREHVDDRARAPRPRRGARPGPRGGSRPATRSATSSVGSSWSPVADDERLDVARRGARAAAPAPAPARRRPRARGDLGPSRIAAQAPDRAQPPAHRLDARADPLERQRLPRREQLDLVRRRGRRRGRGPGARRRPWSGTATTIGRRDRQAGQRRRWRWPGPARARPAPRLDRPRTWVSAGSSWRRPGSGRQRSRHRRPSVRARCRSPVARDSRRVCRTARTPPDERRVTPAERSSVTALARC